MAFLSIRSITQEVVLIENKEYDQLKEFESVTRNAIHHYLDNTYRTTARLALTIHDLLPNPAQNPQNYSFDKLPTVQGLFLYYANSLIYPNVSFITTTQNQLLSGELDPFEKGWLTPPHTKTDRMALIRKRVKRSQNQLLTPFLQKYNVVEIIKLYALIGNHSGTIRYCNKLLEFQPIQGLYSGDITPWLWLTQFRAYIALGRHPDAIELTKKIIGQYFRNPSTYNINQIQFLHSEIFGVLLSYEYLTVRDRDFLWNIHINWQLHTNHTYQFIKHHELLASMNTGGEQSNFGIRSRADSTQIFIKISGNFTGHNQSLTGLFDRTSFFTHILSAIPNTFASKISYRILYDGQIIHANSPTPDVDFYKDISISSHLPKLRLQIYKTGESKLIAMANRKKIFLYSLLATSIITLIVGSAVIIRGIRQEKKLLYMKTNFVSSVSHELKTPITSIKMLSETLKTGRITESSKVAQYSGLIEKESNRLQTLIDDILQYSNWEQSPTTQIVSPIDLSNLVTDIITPFETRCAAKSITLSRAIEASSIIEGNEKSIISVIQNLAGNAIKYTPEGGAIHITVSHDEKEVCYSVEDTGPGIPKNEHRKIFTDFYRVGNELTRTTKGSGLGLAIVKRITDAHNARITVESKPGAGAKFKVFFKYAPQG